MRRKPKKNTVLTQDVYKKKAMEDFLGSIGAEEIIREEKKTPEPRRAVKATPIRSADREDVLKTEETCVGIADIVQTTESDESGGINVLTIKLTDGTTKEFKVRNGYRGVGGGRGAPGKQGPKGDPASVSFRYEEETGKVYYRVSDAEVLDEEAF